MKKSIVWLASYPKSGNTWLRAFLANYIAGRDEPLPINEIPRFGSGDSTTSHYRRLSRGPFDPTDDARVLQMRPKVLEAIASNGADVNLMKSHNKNKVVNGVRLIPATLTRRAIYVIRDPRDILVSYAHHYVLSFEQAVTEIASPNNTILPDQSAVRQYIGGWSENVRSWVSNPGFPVTVIRYEDMQANPVETFSRVLNDIGAPVDPEKVARAVRFSSFSEMQTQEQAAGFIERSSYSDRFFRSGKVGEGADTLEKAILDKLIADHGPTMRHHGYLE